MVKLLDEIHKWFEQKGVKGCDDIMFEGPGIVIYTLDPQFLLEGRKLIKQLVGEFKKRIELRADTSMLLEEGKAEEKIRAILKEAEVKDCYFDSSRSRVIVEVVQVAKGVGREGENISKIIQETHWTPKILRSPPQKSKVVEGLRKELFAESEYRRKFLSKVGKRIYGGWSRRKMHGWVRLTFLGSGLQVGRSSILLQTPESRILLDCGVAVSATNPEDEFPYFDVPDFDLQELDAVVISHAHVDHCALLPYLFRLGYRGPVYCTRPTRDIMALMQLDYLKIANSAKKHNIYDANDIKTVIKHVISLDYGVVTDITPDIRLTLYNAGHILGSAQAHFNIGNGVHNFLYTADINYNFKGALLEPAYTQFARVESMLIESTNAGPNDRHPDRDSAEGVFISTLKEVLGRGGKVLIPAFAVGRSQEVLATLKRLIEEGKLDPVDVYTDGMIGEVCAIHSAYPEYLNKRIRHLINQGDIPFEAPYFKQVGSHTERQELLEQSKPCIIIATSGMMNAGPSIEYFKHLADDERNGVVFVGYQAPNTIGRQLKDGASEVVLSNTGKMSDKVRVRCSVHSVNGFSGHADLTTLKKYLQDLRSKPRLTMVNHGEPEKVGYFAKQINQQIRSRTRTPLNLESVRLF